MAEREGISINIYTKEEGYDLCRSLLWMSSDFQIRTLEGGYQEADDIISRPSQITAVVEFQAYYKHMSILLYETTDDLMNTHVSRRFVASTSAHTLGI